MNNIAIFGSSGAIGSALVNKLSLIYRDANIYAFSQKLPNDGILGVSYKSIDYSSELSVASACSAISNELDLIFVATGILHTQNLFPEKSLAEVSANNFKKVFMANTILPALIAKHLIPKLNLKSKSIFAAISARLGSISDNKLGGWYAYRMSKAALNMFIKTASIEARRSNKNSIIVGLHPGTVASRLSKPFQSGIAKDKLFSAEYSVQRLISVLNNLTTKDTGKCFAWDAEEVLP